MRTMIIPGFNSNNIYDAFSFDVWDSFKDFQLIPNETLGFVNAKTDWKETQEAHVFRAELPGLRREEVEMEVEEDRVLKISGERKVQIEEKRDEWHRAERSRGKFMRVFRLPEDARVDQRVHICASLSSISNLNVSPTRLPEEEEEDTDPLKFKY